MRIVGEIKATVLTKKAMQGSKDPTQVFYRLGVMQGDELGELSVNADTFNSVEQGKPYVFTYTYNTEYKSFQLTSASAGK